MDAWVCLRRKRKERWFSPSSCMRLAGLFWRFWYRGLTSRYKIDRHEECEACHQTHCNGIAMVCNPSILMNFSERQWVYIWWITCLWSPTFTLPAGCGPFPPFPYLILCPWSASPLDSLISHPHPVRTEQQICSIHQMQYSPDIQSWTLVHLPFSLHSWPQQWFLMRCRVPFPAQRL